MKKFTCPTCNKGEVQEVARAGRRMHFRTIPDLEIPAYVAIPTCSNEECGEEWIDRATAARIDAEMEVAFKAASSSKLEEAITKLKKVIAQRDLESLLDLSGGYLSKLKKGKEASPQLVSHLGLLAVDPKQRLAELRAFWRMEPIPAPASEVAQEPVPFTVLETPLPVYRVTRRQPVTSTNLSKGQAKVLPLAQYRQAAGSR